MARQSAEDNRLDGYGASRRFADQSPFPIAKTVDIFPPPGPDRRDSFFAVTLPSSSVNARLYVGVAAQGRSPKVAMLRVYLALLGSGQRWHNSLKRKAKSRTLSDPYMTLVGYFNSLRELGGARRLIEG